MKILHVAEVGRGGVITVMDSLIAGQLETLGVDRVIRLCSGELTCAPHPKLVDLRYARSGRNARSQWALLRALARTLTAESPDIVHLHSSFAGLWGRPLAALLLRSRAQVVYTPHAFSFLPPSRLQQAYAFAERSLASLCSAIVCVSEHEREQAIRHGLPVAKLHLIRNGVESWPDTTKATDDWLRVLFVGRFDHQKGFDVLQRAVALIDPSEPIALRAVGAPDRDSGNALAQVDPRIECLGWLDAHALPEQYRWADVVVVPSRWEAFAMVPLEAMSHGCAVVAADCCSLPEAVSDRETGLLFPVEDAQALADALRGTPPWRFRAMGRAGAARQRAEFVQSGMVEATTSLYRDLLEARAAGAPAIATPPGNLHVLHVVESFAAGTLGIVSQMANQQARDGHRVSLAYSMREETPADWRSRLHAAIEPHHLPMKRSLAPWSDLQSLLALRRLVARLRPDIVHLHSSKAGALGRLASLTVGGPRWFFSPHGLSFLQSSEAGGVHPLYLAAERVLALCPAQFVACSASEAELVDRHLHRPAQLVANGIPLDAIRSRVPREDGELFVGTAGRISPARNPEFFAQVARRLAGRGLRFGWLGGGDPASEQMLREAGVEVTGWLSHGDLLQRLAQLDIYLQPSRWEGMPVAVLEAMATGLPVVATDIVGNRDIVKHGRTGWLASSEEDFIGGVLRLAEDPALRQACGTAASEYVRRHHTTHTMMQSLYDAYGVVTGHAGSPRTA